jgi:hypothetical protein
MRTSASASEFSTIDRIKTGHSPETSKLLGVLRDLIYTANTSMYEIFKVGASAGHLDFDGFKKVFDHVSEGTLSKADIERAWTAVVKTKNGKLSFQTFEETFRSEVPSTAEFETKVIRQVRGWMYTSRLSSEKAFDALCRAAGRFIERTMSRAQFHRACITCEVGLSAA